MENQNYKGGFYRLPRAFFTPSCPLSLEAKVLYALIADRMCLSLKNEWHDKEGTYCFFPVAEAAKLLGCSEGKARRMFNQLEKLHLIKRRRQGLGKPNRLYLVYCNSMLLSRYFSSFVEELFQNPA